MEFREMGNGVLVKGRDGWGGLGDGVELMAIDKGVCAILDIGG